MPIKRCKASFTMFVGGSPRIVNAGDLVDKNDPVIKGREALFEDVETYVSDRTPAPVEQATAAPGERRDVRSRRSKASEAGS